MRGTSRSTALLVAGIFLGGAIDHAILALKRSPVSPYQMRVGVGGNWALALLDLAVAVAIALSALNLRNVREPERRW